MKKEKRGILVLFGFQDSPKVATKKKFEGLEK